MRPQRCSSSVRFPAEPSPGASGAGRPFGAVSTGRTELAEHRRLASSAPPAPPGRRAREALVARVRYISANRRQTSSTGWFTATTMLKVCSR